MSASDKEFANLSVTTLAYSFKINRCKSSRQFKQQTDMTVEEFLFKEKMAREVLLLKTAEEITVKEVSERIGFCTSDYFIRKFRKFFGIAPGRYKMNNKVRVKKEQTRYNNRNIVRFAHN